MRAVSYARLSEDHELIARNSGRRVREHFLTGA